MQKRFCDICEKEAEELGYISHKIKFGEEYISYKNVSQSKEQCYIEVRPHFGFINHKTGFGGPPDLCKKCILDLLDELKRGVELSA